MRLVVFILTIFFGKKVGSDDFGNIYYYSKYKLFGRERRWVMYKGSKEPSKVPDYWEVWLRHISDKPLDISSKNDWQKQHLPNLSGTSFANMYHKNKQIKNANSYQAWEEK
ncbi:MAG: NADH-ubiquinone oxidoreductase subunit NDUFA12 family protein [Alphaproteobacteria bacterium]|jgi:NADH:ubiquinone oxidoreductase subunit|nr:NADH-ubiquinone oxidoreductase subunit NDUFA12 family protein [Alphaproteobacteria bacterium]